MPTARPSLVIWSRQGGGTKQSRSCVPSGSADQEAQKIAGTPPTSPAGAEEMAAQPCSCSNRGRRGPLLTESRHHFMKLVQSYSLSRPANGDPVEGSQVWEGGQEIDHALGREQPPRDRIDLNDLSFLDEWPKQKRLNPQREQTTMTTEHDDNECAMILLMRHTNGKWSADSDPKMIDATLWIAGGNELMMLLTRRDGQWSVHEGHAKAENAFCEHHLSKLPRKKLNLVPGPAPF